MILNYRYFYDSITIVLVSREMRHITLFDFLTQAGTKNDRYSADDILNCILLKFSPKGPIDNKSSLVRRMLSKPIVIQTHTPLVS